MHKRKAARVEGAASASGKEKTVTETGEPAEDLRHKIEFNFDATEEKVMASISEQQMSEYVLGNLLRCGAAAFKMAYASSRGDVQNEVGRLKKQLEDVQAAHAGCTEKANEAAKVIEEGKAHAERLRRISLELQTERDGLLKDMEEARKTIANLSNIQKERDELLKENAELKQEKVEWKNTEAEMLEAIGQEHTKGFNKAF
ncbi:uncharacterized protein LOC106769985 [Vigna radiata var. radiata]|uniref:Uncharacterized protein LOC106769985 n=1 Tax=Vigna radiata var. radiata TaxID=3916 RepID=A0A1S3UYY5_VIGRR|nr:uncharacterized protein LOC106769985 [Vigna radiata var. radiata]